MPTAVIVSGSTWGLCYFLDWVEGVPWFCWKTLGEDRFFESALSDKGQSWPVVAAVSTFDFTKATWKRMFWAQHIAEYKRFQKNQLWCTKAECHHFFHDVSDFELFLERVYLHSPGADQPHSSRTHQHLKSTATGNQAAPWSSLKIILVNVK